MLGVMRGVMRLISNIIFSGVMIVLAYYLLIHDYAPFHFMVSISDEYTGKFKRFVETAFKSCGKPYLPRNLPHAQLKCRLSSLSQPRLLVSIELDIV